MFCLLCPWLCPLVDCADNWLEEKHRAAYSGILRQGWFLWLLPLASVLSAMEEHFFPLLHAKVCFGMLDVSELLEYLPYFGFGLCMCAKRGAGGTVQPNAIRAVERAAVCRVADAVCQPIRAIAHAARCGGLRAGAVDLVRLPGMFRTVSPLFESAVPAVRVHVRRVLHGLPVSSRVSDRGGRVAARAAAALVREVSGRRDGDARVDGECAPICGAPRAAATLVV